MQIHKSHPVDFQICKRNSSYYWKKSELKYVLWLLSAGNFIFIRLNESSLFMFKATKDCAAWTCIQSIPFSVLCRPNWKNNLGNRKTEETRQWINPIFLAMALFFFFQKQNPIALQISRCIWNIFIEKRNVLRAYKSNSIELFGLKSLQSTCLLCVRFFGLLFEPILCFFSLSPFYIWSLETIQNGMEYTIREWEPNEFLWCV